MAQRIALLGIGLRQGPCQGDLPRGSIHTGDSIDFGVGDVEAGVASQLPCSDEHIVFGGELPCIAWRNGVYSVHTRPLRLHGGRDVRHDTAHYIPKDMEQGTPSVHLRDTQERFSWHPLQRRITVSYAQGPTIAISQGSSRPGRHGVSA